MVLNEFDEIPTTEGTSAIQRQENRKNRLLKYREEQGWTQEEAAAEIGVNPATWWWWETKGRMMRMGHLRKLHDLTGFSYDYLRGE